jgi:hypothetical protein
VDHGGEWELAPSDHGGQGRLLPRWLDRFAGAGLGGLVVGAAWRKLGFQSFTHPQVKATQFYRKTTLQNGSNIFNTSAISPLYND